MSTQMKKQDMPHFQRIQALHTAFLALVADDEEFTVDKALDFLGSFIFAEFQTAYRLYEAQGYAYPHGRLLVVMGGILHSLAHVPSYMDIRGDEWMMDREAIVYPMYDGGPLLAEMPTLQPWEAEMIVSFQDETEDHTED